MWDGFWGAVIGSLVAAALAVLTNVWFAWQQAKDRRLGLAYSVFFKVHRMGDQTLKISAYINERWEPSEKGRHWERLTPVAGIRAEDHTFTPEELSLFAAELGRQFSQSLMTAANYYHLLIDLLMEYGRARRSLQESFAAAGIVTMEDNVGTVRAPADIAKKFIPAMQEVERFAVLLHEVANDAQREIAPLAEGLGLKLSTTLKDKRFRLRAGPVTSEGAGPLVQ